MGRRESSSSTVKALVQSFHEAVGIRPEGTSTEEALLSDRVRRKYESMLDSEVSELKSHLARREADKVARELADIVYTAYGAALEMHLDLDEWILKVHAANLSRRSADGTVQRRADGKILKGKEYREPTGG